MPKLEPRDVQKELESGWIWPVYWLYGQERMKSRELLKRIKSAVLGDSPLAGFGFGEEVLDGSEVSAVQVVDSAQSLTLGGGLRLVVVRDAQAIKDSDALSVLFGPRSKKEDLTSVCVFLSKDLDGRKKFSKILTEKAAVVSCDAVPEQDREAWIGYLAKRRGLALAPEQVVLLRSLDPWNLDIVDQELEKVALLSQTADASDSLDALLGSAGGDFKSEDFVEAFFGRDLKKSLEIVETFAESPELALPLLGLLGWNVRYLALVCADREQRTKTAKLSPYLAERFNRWSRGWSLSEVVSLQSALADVDFSIKQTARVPIGLWSNLVITFCSER